MSIALFAAIAIGALVAGVLLVLAARAMDRPAGVGKYADRLADPTRCPDCGRPYEAADDAVSPHECREVGF